MLPPRRNSPRNGPVHYEWHWIWNYGNGDVGNQGIHQMDVARWFLGEPGLPRHTFSIGGRVGSTVGQKLWGLSKHHQVVCITHLPQLAGYGDAHLKVEKQIDGDRTLTHVSTLDGETRVEELAQMLGASGEGATLSAQEILANVAEVKSK